ncbi:MAG: AI-2E family transporter [Ruminococcus sp.]|nr:AI-2E family transporter [Ruminococcus sp.]
MDKKEIKRYVFIAFLAVAVCVIVQNFSVFQNLVLLALKAMRPIFIGCVLAYIFNIIMNFFEKHYFPKKNTKLIKNTRRPVCLILSFAIVIGTIALVLNIIIPEIVNAFKIIYAEIPPLFIKVRDMVLDKLDEYPEISKELENIEIDKAGLVEKATNGAFGLFGSVLTMIGAVTSAVASVIIGAIFAIYLLLRKDKLFTDINRMMRISLSEGTIAKINRFFAMAHETFTNFFIGQFIEAILLGTLTFIGASLLHLPYAAMTGTIIGVTALIPIVGALSGAALSALIICTVSPAKAVVFLVFLIILQQFDDNVIYPKIMGTSVGLPGIWVLASVTVGGSLFGIMGMVLGVPLAATIYKLYFQDLESKEAAMGIPLPDSEEEVMIAPSKPVMKKKRTKKK